jgi:G3E family GTPase
MIKLDVISGFLGAGKTTFIKKLLRDCGGEDIVIVENEFGEIGIDGEILEREGYKMYEISTGCICCLMQKGFVDTLQAIIRDHHPDRIVIEPTGISILSDIVKSLRREPFTRTCAINALITIVDCENYLRQCDVFGEFFEDQIANATRLVFSKSALVDRKTVEETYVSVRCKNPTAPVVIKNWDDFTVEELHGYIDGDLIWERDGAPAMPDRRSCRDGLFSTFSRKIDYALSKEDLARKLESLRDGACGEVLRGKGFVNCTDGSFEFSCTQSRFELYPMDEPVSGRVCFIGVGLNQQGLDGLWRDPNERRVQLDVLAGKAD